MAEHLRPQSHDSDPPTQPSWEAVNHSQPEPQLASMVPSLGKPPSPSPQGLQALLSCAVWLRAVALISLSGPSQPHLCSVYHPLCSQTCRCTCTTVGCSGRQHRCGSCRSPPHIRPHLAGAEGARETLCQCIPKGVFFSPRGVLKVVPQGQNALSSKIEIVTPPRAGALSHPSDFRVGQLCNFRNSENTPTPLRNT